jgi:hypothetical protein
MGPKRIIPGLAPWDRGISTDLEVKATLVDRLIILVLAPDHIASHACLSQMLMATRDGILERSRVEVGCHTAKALCIIAMEG